MRGKTISALTIATMLHSVSMTSAAKADAAKPGDQFAKILDDYLPILKEYGLVPIVVPQGQQVGDIFDARGWRLLATADDCFPGLTVRRAPTALPSISGHGTKALTAALGLPVVASADVDLGENKDYTLTFSDAVAISASLVQLRLKLQSGVAECDSVRPFLEAVNSDQEARPPPGTNAVNPPLLFGTIIEARRIVRVNVANIAQANAKVSIFSNWLTRVGLGTAEVKVTAKDNGEATVEIVGTAPMSVAFRPAYIFYDTAHDIITYRVTDFDPTRPKDTEHLGDLLSGAFVPTSP